MSILTRLTSFFRSAAPLKPIAALPHELGLSDPPKRSYIVTGKMSRFGGPKDTGVSPSEGLALIDREEINKPRFTALFLGSQPIGTTGIARRLNPNAFFCAMRWAYTKDMEGKDIGFGPLLPVTTPRSFLRDALIKVSANGRSIYVRPVDAGPDFHRSQGCIIDLSDGAANHLGLSSHDTCTVEIPLP